MMILKMKHLLVSVVACVILGSVRASVGTKKITDCPSDWKRHNEDCFYISETAESWDDAKSFCESRKDASLIYPTYETRGKPLTAFLNGSRYGDIFNGLKQGDKFWIGTKRNIGGREYLWLNDKKIPTEWTKKQSSIPESVKQCFYYTMGNNKLQGTNCTFSNLFICQRMAPLTKECPFDWESLNGDCFKRNFDTKRWDQAQYLCGQSLAGANLVQPRNATQGKPLYDLLNRYTDGNIKFWIGAENIFEAAYWWLNGIKITNGWYTGEPDNNGIKCVEFFSRSRTNFGLRTRSCSSVQSFICQKSLNSFKTTTSTTITQECPTNWKRLHDDCFFLSGDRTRSWEAGKSFCEDEGATLAQPTDATQKTALAGLFSGQNVYQYWVGARMENASISKWVNGDEVVIGGKNKGKSDTTNEVGCMYMTYPKLTIDDEISFEIEECSIRIQPNRLQSICHKDCPPGWKSLHDSCFYISKDAKPWEEARSFCEGHQGVALAQLSDTRQHPDLADILNWSEDEDREFWVGARNEISSSYKWLNGDRMSYNGWRYRQPSSAIDPEGCVSLYYPNENDHKAIGLEVSNCIDTYKFICQGPIGTKAPPSANSTITSTQDCPTDWIRNDPDCFYISADAKQWEEAKSFCDSHQGATLIQPTDDSKAQILTARLNGSADGDQKFWVGARKQNVTLYKWLNGDELNSEWNKRQPDPTGVGQCFGISYPNQKIYNEVNRNVWNCTTSNRFICQISHAPAPKCPNSPWGSCRRKTVNAKDRNWTGFKNYCEARSYSRGNTVHRTQIQAVATLLKEYEPRQNDMPTYNGKFWWKPKPRKKQPTRPKWPGNNRKPYWNKDPDYYHEAEESFDHRRHKEPRPGIPGRYPEYFDDYRRPGIERPGVGWGGGGWGGGGFYPEYVPPVPSKPEPVKCIALEYTEDSESGCSEKGWEIWDTGDPDNIKRRSICWIPPPGPPIDPTIPPTPPPPVTKPPPIDNTKRTVALLVSWAVLILLLMGTLSVIYYPQRRGRKATSGITRT